MGTAYGATSASQEATNYPNWLVSMQPLFQIRKT
jgi:hypothetical protein